jgi:hypothetical protein
MATPESIAKRAALAEREVEKSLSALAGHFKVERTEAMFVRDPDLKRAIYLETVAATLQNILTAVKGKQNVGMANKKES